MELNASQRSNSSGEDEVDERFSSNMTDLHFAAAALGISTAYIIVEKDEEESVAQNKLVFEYKNGISYTEVLLTSGYFSLIEIYKDIREKNERLSFDLVVNSFCKIASHMADIDIALSRIQEEDNYKELYDSIIEEFESKYIDFEINLWKFFVYRCIKSKAPDDLSDYDQDQVLLIAQKIIDDKKKKDEEEEEEEDDLDFNEYQDVVEFCDGFDKIYGELFVDEINIDKEGVLRLNHDGIVKLIANFESTFAFRKTGIESSRYVSINDVVNAAVRFDREKDAYMMEDESRIEDIKWYQQELRNIEQNPDDPVMVSDITELSSTLLVRPRFTKVLPNESEPIDIFPNELDGLDIFNDSRATKYVPYIQYNDSDGKSYYKVLSGDIDYEQMGFTTTGSATENNDIIYGVLWLDEGDGASPENEDDDPYDWETMITSPTNSFYPFTYNLVDGIMEISIPNKNKVTQISNPEDIIPRLNSSFTNMSIDAVEESKIKGYFDVYGVVIEEASFMYALMVNPLFYHYLYAEEKLRPFAFKHRFDIHYNGLYSYMGEQIKIVSNNIATLPYEYRSISFSFQLRELKENDTDVPEEINTLSGARFVINGTARYEMIEEAKEVIHALLIRYKQLQETYDNTLRQFITEDESDFLSKRHYTRIVEELEGGLQFAKTKQRVKELKDKAPELFVDGYAGICQNTGQPIIIEDEDVEEWENQTFVHHGEKLNRQVMRFPPDDALDSPDDPQWNFVCPNDNRPFPGVSYNNTLSNKEKYKVIPCCYQQDHISENAPSPYNEYFRNRLKKASYKDPSQTISTNKIAKYGQNGKLPVAFTNSLSLYRNSLNLPGEPEDWVISRTGVQYSPNACIHTILLAMVDEPYFRAKTDQQRENRAIAIRSEITKLMIKYPDIIAQENTDRSIESILEEISNENLYLDPERYVHVLEEYFNINIFIYELVGTDGIDVIIPPHKGFYIKIKRLDRPTVLLLKQYASHTELIIDYNVKRKESINLFDITMLDICSNLFDSANGNIVWFPYTNDIIGLNQLAYPIFSYENVFNLYHTPSILGGGMIGNENNIHGQYIDPYGKVRAFIINYYPNGPQKDSFQVTFFVPPTVPELVPKIGSRTEFVSANINDVLEVMNDTIITAVVKNNTGEIIGLWYPYTAFREGIYIPIDPTNDYPKHLDEIDPGSPHPLMIEVEDQPEFAHRHIVLKKILKFFLEIIEWLYEVYRRDEFMRGIDTPDPNTFFERVFAVENKIGVDSTNYFEFSIERLLPEVDNLDSAMEYIQSTVKPTDDDGKIVLYSQKLADNLLVKIVEYHEQTFLAEPHIKTSIRSFYEKSEDFKHDEYNIVIIGSDNMKNWISNKKRMSSSETVIKTNLDLSIANTLEPVLYRDPNGDDWIIQNTINGSLNSALAVANNWVIMQVNTGYKTKPIADDAELPSHYVFIISENQQLVATIDNTNEEDQNFLFVLNYAPGIYGALLPLQGME
jgi:hypothetical protein